MAIRYPYAAKLHNAPEGTREIKIRLRRAVASGAHPRRISSFESLGRYKNNPNPQMWFGLFFFGNNKQV